MLASICGFSVVLDSSLLSCQMTGQRPVPLRFVCSSFCGFPALLAGVRLAPANCCVNSGLLSFSFIFMRIMFDPMFIDRFIFSL